MTLSVVADGVGNTVLTFEALPISADVEAACDFNFRPHTKLKGKTSVHYLWDFVLGSLKEHVAGSHTWSRHVVELPRQRDP